MNVETPTVDWFALSPVLALLAASGVALLTAVLLPRRRRKAFAWVAVASGSIVAFVFAVLLFADSEEARAVTGGGMVRDRFGALAMAIVCGATFVSTLLSWGERAGDDPAASERTRPQSQFGETDHVASGRTRLQSQVAETDHSGEYYALLAAAASGMCFFVSANNLMTLFLGLEWFSIALYVLCAVHAERSKALEAGLKYLIVGSFGSSVLLFGSALVYGATGELSWSGIAERASGDDALLLAGLAMVLAGLGFKASAAPFHMWTPDVYEGAPTPVTAFMSAATKTVALVVALRVLVTAFPEQEELWTIAVAVIAIASIAIGNLAALVQRNVKRILAYSSVSHAGFMLIPVAANNELGGRALLYYLIPYGAASLGAFAVVAARERELNRSVDLDDLAGFGWERPFLGLALAAFAFAFIGLPTGGLFAGKFYAFAAAADRDWWWLVIAGVIGTVISVYYYLAIIGAMYFRSGAELQLRPAGGSPPREALLTTGVAACLVVSVGSLLAVQPLIDIARDAAATLFP